MIVDTSALIAIAGREKHADRLSEALLDEPSFIPAPALVEFERVSFKKGVAFYESAQFFLAKWLSFRLQILPFDSEMARVASEANSRFGSGNFRGGTLNLLDLMVYATSKHTGRPILCTGKDYRATDALIHDASRPD